MMGYNAPRYGVWSLDPYNAPTAMGIAMNTAQGIGNMQSTWAKNQMQQQQNSMMQQTMPGLIGATNAQNQAMSQYALPNAAANNQGLVSRNNLTNAQIGLTGAQTGLAGAQTNLANANADVTQGVQDPTTAWLHLKNVYDNTADGTIEKQYIGGILNKMMLTTTAGGYMPGASQPPAQAPSAAPTSSDQGSPMMSPPPSAPQEPMNPVNQRWSLGWGADGRYYDNNWNAYSPTDLKNMAGGNQQ